MHHLTAFSRLFGVAYLLVSKIIRIIAAETKGDFNGYFTGWI
jgi:hypothetical protein